LTNLRTKKAFESAMKAFESAMMMRRRRRMRRIIG
jgi:hypothetical protein